MLKRILKIAVLLIGLGIIAIQFVRPDFSSAPVVEAETLRADGQVPADVQEVISRSCIDCHSNETRYPWYSNVTPFNWFLADHIEQGRHELNFSVWNTFTPEKKVRMIDEICEQVEEREMPLPSYLWIHREAVMSEADVALLCGWARAGSERAPK